MGRTIINVQYLRAIAALGVVMFHTTSLKGHAFLLGTAGVDLFFVVSGFIMWRVTERESAPGLFLWRRLVRIVPMYWLVTAALAVRTHPGAAELIQSLLFIPHYNATGQIWPVLVPGWTLSYEMFFYALFAVALLAPRAMQAWLLTGAIGLLCALHPLAGHAAVPRTFTDPIMLEFVAGIWIAKAPRPTVAVGASALVLALAALCMLQLFRIHSDPWRAALYGAPAALLLIGALGFEAKTPKVSALLLLGNASYSLYLVQGLLIGQLERAAHQTWITVIVTALGGVVIYKLIEEPMNRGIRWLSKRVGRGAAKPALSPASP